MVYLFNSDVTLKATTQLDSFNRLRVSNPHTIFDSQNRYKLNSKFYSNLASGGTVNYIQAQSSANLAVTSTSGSLVIRESKQVFVYQPGKSLLVMNTFVMDPAKTGLRQRIGYFGAENGYYVQLDGTALGLVERSNVTGTVQETTVLQSSWNIDKMLGTGPSGMTLDITKAQIFWIDMEWLGVGHVRTGFIQNGTYINCHTFYHANIVRSSYTTTAVLPIRYEIQNTAGTTGSSNLMQICSTVISEGGYMAKEDLHIQSRGLTTATTGTMIPIASIRLRPGRLDSAVSIKQVNVVVETINDVCQWFIVLNGTLNGGTSWTNHATSDAVQYDIGSTAITGGSNVYTGYTQFATPTSPLDIDTFELQIGRDSMAQVSDVVTLCVYGLTTNPKVFGAITWAELV